MGEPQKPKNYVDIGNILTLRRLAGQPAQGRFPKLRVCTALLIYFLYLHNFKVLATQKTRVLKCNIRKRNKKKEIDFFKIV